jgi:hypothetical protein
VSGPTRGRGAVVVAVCLAGLLGACALEPEGPATTSKSAAAGGLEVGVLESGDETLETGELVDSYTFHGETGQRVDLSLVSDDFDTYLVLLGPEGQLLENDDDEAGDSSIGVRLSSPGDHRVLVTSYEPGESGEYRLEIRLGEVAPLPELAEITLGETVEGRLEDSDDWPWVGKPADGYRFQAAAGTPVELTLESGDVDTYLELFFPDGVSLDNDDDWERQERSRLELTLPQSGEYMVWASAYGREERGDYTLSLRRSRGAAPLRGAPARTFALLTGIGDYAGEGNDLAYTADDPRKLQRVLIDRAGVAPGDTVVLVDAEVTLAGFRSSLEQLARRMTASDELVLFYSGHGGRVRRASYQSADPDAVDETLTLYDGDLTDDDLAELLADVPGRVLLVLDSCFSGGFAKDVISRPGRMGIFSSEEDVTSLVAGKFEAGGYLAAFLASALTDEWADDGDGRLTALELSHYLHESYRTGVKGVGPDDYVSTSEPTLGYQRLVVDRGSLAPTDILFDLAGER